MSFDEPAFFCSLSFSLLRFFSACIFGAGCDSIPLNVPFCGCCGTTDMVCVTAGGCGCAVATAAASTAMSSCCGGITVASRGGSCGATGAGPMWRVNVRIASDIWLVPLRLRAGTSSCQPWPMARELLLRRSHDASPDAPSWRMPVPFLERSRTLRGPLPPAGQNSSVWRAETPSRSRTMSLFAVRPMPTVRPGCSKKHFLLLPLPAIIVSSPLQVPSAP
mmetsp:Transcript_83870/g.166449  ORF Transcript_83870/g.166449 Transcript_83870/m.166449 type:complete len:220 (-) Transcript_83870:150-809(-)